VIETVDATRESLPEARRDLRTTIDRFAGALRTVSTTRSTEHAKGT
jgi:hypothetical protein